MCNKTLKVEDNIHIKTIVKICELFNAPLKKRGFLYPGSAIHPTKENVVIWWPSAMGRKKWINIVNDSYSEIIETHEDDLRRVEHVNNLLRNSNETRYVFLYNKFYKGRPTYKFIGVFKLDVARTSTQKGLVWIKISNQISMKNE